MRVVNDEFSEIRARLRNWGRVQFRELMRDAPDKSCVNPIYQMGRTADDGWGEIDAETVIVDQPGMFRVEREPLDEIDAENMHGWIRQTPKTAQHTLWQAFVYRRRVEGLTSALRAILAAMDANRRVVERMRDAS